MISKIEYVHKSQMGTIKRCSRQLYYKDILQLQTKFVNESALAGQAVHKFAEEIYRSDKPDKWDDWKYWIEFFVDDLNLRKEECISNGIEINYVEDLKAEDYAEMIVEFLKQPYNRHAQPILIESPFRFTIKRGRSQYKFEGRIDQLLKINTKYLPFYEISNAFGIKEVDIYIHRDIKSGRRTQHSDIGLATDDDLNVYAYALAYGMFDLKGSWEYNKLVHHIPFAHALYYMRDHNKYKRATKEKKAGDYKGIGMYFIRKDLNDLKNMEDELINLHKKINSGIYTRDGAVTGLCDRYCGFKDVCLHEWKKYG